MEAIVELRFPLVKREFECFERCLVKITWIQPLPGSLRIRMALNFEAYALSGQSCRPSEWPLTNLRPTDLANALSMLTGPNAPNEGKSSFAR